MQHDPDCFVCGAHEWLDLGERYYDRPARYTGTRQYKNAMKVLFEVWAPDQDRFTVRFAGCRRCGFLTYLPRPSADDVSRKYQVRPEPDATGEQDRVHGESRQELRRRRRLTEIVLRESGTRDPASLRVLDFGGGDGHMLGGLVARGAVCHLVDYSDDVHPGVTKIGNTEHDIPLDASYDAIVCSHVVEHLPEPRKALAALRDRLAPAGILYVEVPIEVIGELPAKHEPVTHLNFFTPESMRTLLETTGYAVRRCRMVAQPHPWGYRQLCVGAIATRGAGADPQMTLAGVQALQRYLNGSASIRLRRRRVLGLETPDVLRKRLRKIPYLWRYF